MITADELKHLREKIDAEYAKDIEALQRLSRYLPNSSAMGLTIEFSSTAQSRGQGNVTDPNATLLSSGSRSILGGLEAIISENQDRTWTGTQLRSELERRGYELLAHNPGATIAVSLKKLVDRGKVSIVRHGSGREPHIYQWRRIETADCEVIEAEHEAA